MKRYALASERLVFVKPAEQAAMDAADREFKQADEGQQRCFSLISPRRDPARRREPQGRIMKAIMWLSCAVSAVSAVLLALDIAGVIFT